MFRRKAVGWTHSHHGTYDTSSKATFCKSSASCFLFGSSVARTQSSTSWSSCGIWSRLCAPALPRSVQDRIEGRLSTQLSRFPDRRQRSAMGHEDAFPRPKLRGRCRFSQRTFTRTRSNGRDAPTAAIHRAANNEGHGIIRRNPGVENGARSRRGSGLRFEDSVRCAVCLSSPIHALNPQ